MISLRPAGFDELGLRRALSDRMLPFLVAAMAFLAALALAGWIGAAALARHWQDGVGSALTGAYTHGLLDGHDPHLAITDLAGVGGADDGLNDFIHLGVIDEDLQLELGYEVNFVLGSAVHLGVTALASKALGLGDRHTTDVQGLQAFLHVIQLEGLENCDNEFHVRSSFFSY